MVAAMIILLSCELLSAGQAEDREWTDSSGHYRVDAEMIAHTDTEVVLEKTNDELIAIPIDQLSADDQNYLKSKEASESILKSAESRRTWTMQGGLKVSGRVIDYAQRELTIRRQFGKIYVNDKVYGNLPAVYQEMLPRIIAHFENTEIDGKKGLDAWAMKHLAKPRTYQCEGVLLELENGDQYGIPFFFFSEADLEVLRPGWERWLAAKDSYEQQEQQSFLLRSQAQAYDEQQKQMMHIAQLQLQVQAYDAGFFDLWEVALYPPRGSNGMPLSVVVPGRNSQQASTAALQQYPNYAVGAIAKVLRRN